MSLDRRTFLKVAGAGATGAMVSELPGFADSGRQAADLPNIVLCMADDQGWGDMGYYGHPHLQTPNFDEMAAEGLRFDRFYAAAPVCTPTRGSVMTGRHPNRFGAFQWGRTLHPLEITLPEALKTAGYVTGHFGKWHLGPVRKGTLTNPGAAGFDRWVSAPNFFDNDPLLSREGIVESFEGESSMVTVDLALEFIQNHADTDRPFLALVWFGSPHSPHEALDRDRALYAEHAEELQHFYGEITAMDRAFGKLRQGLRELGIHQDTILWYCSDNGGLPEMGATGGRGAKGDVYEGGLRVPAILEWPDRLSVPRTTNLPCNTSDIYPTLLDIVGVEFEHQPPLDGVSLTPLFEGSMDSRPPMGFWDYPERGVLRDSYELLSDLREAQQQGNIVGDLSEVRLDAWKHPEDFPGDAFPGHAAWLDWPWKVHRIEEEGEEEGQQEIRWELYNLADDPDEQSDLIDDRTDRTDAMKTALEEWQASVVRSMDGADYGA
jgi:arylsulfatase A-like enzyme